MHKKSITGIFEIIKNEWIIFHYSNKRSYITLELYTYAMKKYILLKGYF